MNYNKAEKILGDLGKKIDELIARAKTSEYVEKLDLDKRIEELKKNRDRLEEDINNFTQNSDEHWKNLEKRGQEVSNDIKDALDSIFGNKK